MKSNKLTPTDILSPTAIAAISAIIIALGIGALQDWSGSGGLKAQKNAEMKSVAEQNKEFFKNKINKEHPEIVSYGKAQVIPGSLFQMSDIDGNSVNESTPNKYKLIYIGCAACKNTNGQIATDEYSLFAMSHIIESMVYTKKSLSQVNAMSKTVGGVLGVKDSGQLVPEDLELVFISNRPDIDTPNALQMIFKGHSFIGSILRGTQDQTNEAVKKFDEFGNTHQEQWKSCGVKPDLVFLVGPGGEIMLTRPSTRGTSSKYCDLRAMSDGFRNAIRFSVGYESQ